MSAAPPVPEALARAARGRPGLRLLLLHGSRARTDHRPASDWDLGYLADDDFEPDALLASLVTALGTDDVDLVDLRRAGALLRQRAARDAIPVFDGGDELARFQLAASSFWCDVEPVLRMAYQGYLAGFGPAGARSA